jgi:hypothetical protein
MPTTSRGLRYPAGGSSPAVYIDIQNLAADVDPNIVRHYASTAARNTAIPSPTVNEAVVTAGRLQVHNGTLWLQAITGVFGNAGSATDGSGNVIISHGLGTTPTLVLTQATGGPIQSSAQYVVTASSSTTFTVTVYNSTTGAAIPGNPTSFTWLAIV